MDEHQDERGCEMVGCAVRVPREAMTTIDTMTPAGDHETKEICPLCAQALQETKESQRVQVTREMAKDAGEPGMEGMWIDW